jgi:hypothetical protein
MSKVTLAAEGGNLQRVQWLLQNGAYITKRDDRRDTTTFLTSAGRAALLWAVFNGDMQRNG